MIGLPTHDRLQTVIREGACRAVIDGEQGAGQFETHWQGSYLDYLVGPGAHDVVLVLVTSSNGWAHSWPSVACAARR